MKRMRFLWFIFLFCYPLSCWGNPNGEIIQYWLDKVANGVHDLKQVLFPFDRAFEYIFSFPEMRNPPKEHFLSFIRATEGTMECWFRASGATTSIDRGFFFDTKAVPKETISKILNRRIPIINNFDYDKTKYDDDDPKYIALATPGFGTCYDYLGLFQIRLVIMLFVSEDYRFQTEAENLLNYIQNPPDPSKTYDRMDQEAFYCYTSRTRIDLPGFLLNYIKSCKTQLNQK